MNRKDVSINVSESLDICQNIQKYVEKLGGPEKLEKGSIHATLYDAARAWTNGLSFAEHGEGIKAIDCLVIGLTLDRRACVHILFKSTGSTTYTHVQKAMENLKKHIADMDIPAEDKKCISDIYECKLLLLRAHYLKSLPRFQETAESIDLAVAKILRARETWGSKFSKEHANEILLVLYDLACDNIAIEANTSSDPTKLLKSSLNFSSKALEIAPNNITAIMNKAGVLWNLVLRTQDKALGMEVAQLYRKAMENALDGDQNKTIAAYQYAFCKLCMLERPGQVPIGVIRKLHTRAEALDRLSKPLFGQTKCMGKTAKKQAPKDSHLLPDDHPVSIDLLRSSTQAEQQEKIRAALQKPGTNIIQNYEQKTPARCQNCLQRAVGLKHCSRCKSAWYCSQECQKQDWKTHKPVCAPKADKELRQENESPEDFVRYLSEQLKARGFPVPDQNRK